MNLARALTSALALEERIARLYAGAAGRCRSPGLRSFFESMAAEEEEHVLFLRARRAQYARTGRVDPAALEPPGRAGPEIEDVSDVLEALAGGVEQGSGLAALVRAHEMEVEAHRFYRAVTAALAGEARLLFGPFVEVEASHVAAVARELRRAAGDRNDIDALGDAR